MDRRISVVLIFLFLNISCHETNKISSTNYISVDKKIEVLKLYFNFKSPIINTEFEIYDVNINNRSIPGPTDRNYKIILKVDKRYLDEWQDTSELIQYPINFEWINTIMFDRNDFKLYGSKLMYKSEYIEMIIYEESGVILISIIQN